VNGFPVLKSLIVFTPPAEARFLSGAELMQVSSNIYYYYSIDETEIITGCKNVPEIWYNDINGKKEDIL
jgi:hypothetical protein